MFSGLLNIALNIVPRTVLGLWENVFGKIATGAVFW